MNENVDEIDAAHVIQRFVHQSATLLEHQQAGFAAADKIEKQIKMLASAIGSLNNHVKTIAAGKVQVDAGPAAATMKEAANIANRRAAEIKADFAVLHTNKILILLFAAAATGGTVGTVLTIFALRWL